MLRDIKIGSGNYGCSAVVVSGIRNDDLNNISENNVSFWIDHAIFDCELKIMKNTEEGKILKTKIDNGESIEIINRFIDNQVIKRISITDIYQEIEEVYNKGFNKGVQSTQLEMQYALGL